MKNILKLSAVIFVILCIFIPGAVAAQDAQNTEYRLQSGDVLNITVHNQPDLTTKVRITKDGYITFPLLGRVEAKGFTILELEQKLKSLLEKDYLVTAQVLVFIEEYHMRQISVMGEVKAPGKYEIPSEKPITLMQAIGMAQGFKKDADSKNVTVMRMIDGEHRSILINTKDITVGGDRSKDIIMEIGDVVLVPEAFSEVSVMGEVNKPGKYEMPQEKDVTLLEAIAMAEGFTKDADVTKVKVMRVEGGEKRTIVINVNDITHKDEKEKDIVLKPEDIIYVPESFF